MYIICDSYYMHNVQCVGPSPLPSLIHKVPLPPQIDKGRMCHSLGAYFPSACEAHVVGFGGLPGKIEKDAAFTSFTPLEETIVLLFGKYMYIVHRTCYDIPLHLFFWNLTTPFVSRYPHPVSELYQLYSQSHRRLQSTTAIFASSCSVGYHKRK